MFRRHRLIQRLLPVFTTMVATVLLTGAGTAVRAADAPGPDVSRWIRHNGVRLVTTDSAAPLHDLTPLGRMVGDATIVGLGESTHGAREEFLLKQRVLRYLVEKAGFRSIAWEDDWTLGLQINDYILTGEGDLDALVREMSRAWQTREVKDLLRWLRAYNSGHADKIRFAGVEYWTTRTTAYDAVEAYVAESAPAALPEARGHIAAIRPDRPIGEYARWYYFDVTDKQPYIDHARSLYELVERLPRPSGDRDHSLALHHARQIRSFYEHYSLTDNLDYRDTRAAENLRWWQRYTGDKVVYWAAIPHTADAPGMRVSLPPAPEVGWDAAGSHIRRWYGRQYRSIGFTFDHGAVRGDAGALEIPRPPRDFAERPLGDAGLEQFALDLRTAAPPAVREWRNRPAKIRTVAGTYDAQQGDGYYMAGGSLAQWFDVIIHRQEVTPTRPA